MPKIIDISKVTNEELRKITDQIIEENKVELPKKD